MRWIGNFEAEFGRGMDEDFGVDGELFFGISEGPIVDGSWSSEEKEARDSGCCLRWPGWCVGAEAKLSRDKRSSDTLDLSSSSLDKEFITAGDDILRTFRAWLLRSCWTSPELTDSKSPLQHSAANSPQTTAYKNTNYHQMLPTVEYLVVGNIHLWQVAGNTCVIPYGRWCSTSLRMWWVSYEQLYHSTINH